MRHFAGKYRNARILVNQVVEKICPPEENLLNTSNMYFERGILSSAVDTGSAIDSRTGQGMAGVVGECVQRYIMVRQQKSEAPSNIHCQRCRSVIHRNAS